MKEHPYPPIVRWALLPALAALAGAAGGSAAGLFIVEAPHAPRVALISGTLAACSALASVLTLRRWPTFVCAPLFGLAGLATGIVLAEAVAGGGPSDPWTWLTRLAGQLRAVLVVIGVSVPQAAGHLLTRGGTWRFGLAAWSLAALLVLGVTYPLVHAFERPLVPAVLAGSTFAQLVAVTTSSAIARRLRPT